MLGRDKCEKRALVRQSRPPRRYTPEVQDALVTVWEAAKRIYSKRLVPYLETLVESLERHGHLDLDQETRRRLVSMSAATVDRLLYRVRHGDATRPRSFPSGCPSLKATIPLPTFDDWSEEGRGNQVRTRSQRLAAVRASFDYLACQEPLMLAEAQRVALISVKRTTPPETIYLERDEVNALFAGIPYEGRFALRGRVLLLFLYNTGARVQEAADLRRTHLELDA